MELFRFHLPISPVLQFCTPPPTHTHTHERQFDRGRNTCTASYEYPGDGKWAQMPWNFRYLDVLLILAK